MRIAHAFPRRRSAWLAALAFVALGSALPGSSHGQVLRSNLWVTNGLVSSVAVSGSGCVYRRVGSGSSFRKEFCEALLLNALVSFDKDFLENGECRKCRDTYPHMQIYKRNTTF